jgi:membrane protease YdiL (CAAX protease family)
VLELLFPANSQLMVDASNEQPSMANQDFTEPPGEARNITAVAVVFEGGLAGVALLAGWWLGQSPCVGIQFDRASWPDQAVAALARAAAALPLLLGLVLMDRYPVGPLRALQEFMDRHVVPLFRHTPAWQLALIAVVAGLGEELLFRGLFQHGLAEWIGAPHGVWIALLVASLAFGLCHAVTACYAVLAGLIGVYLGGLFLLTGNVLAPIVAHAVYDFVALVYLVRDPPHGEA